MASKVIVIGAGVGGLTAAALLAQQGFDVSVLEAQTYPGGCASTFTHKGFRFESGATVVGGFQANGPHKIVGDKLGIDWPVVPHDPAWVTHLPDRSIALTSDNCDVLDKFLGTEQFWEQQSQMADIAWKLSAQGLPWPPRSIAELSQLAKVAALNFPGDLRVLPFAFSTVYQWLKWHSLHTNHEFVRFLDAQLLISAQTTTKQVNALYGATALDLARQGVFHVKGGIGGIAESLVNRIEYCGGEVRYRHHVTRIEVKNGQASGVWFTVGKRAKEEEFIPCNFVIGNTTPWNMNTLLAENSRASLEKETAKRRYGWGAFVLHLGIDDSAIPDDFPDHHQVIRDYESPLGETNSIFLSLSPQWDTSRAPEGQRALTVTTHTHVNHWWDLINHDEDAYYAEKQSYEEKILTHMEKIIPAIRNHLTLSLPGTPVTYNFYTQRHKGMVGGFPQTSLFKARGPRTGIQNIRLVGDSIFPGQSTAGVTLGAMRVVEDVIHSLPKIKNVTHARKVSEQSESEQQVLEPIQ